MVVLGLGSNLGDRFKQLRQALNFLKQLPHFEIEEVSPLYISDALMPEKSPTNWDVPYLNCALRCKTTLSPEELLNQTKLIEKKVGRTPEKLWGPRIIDIDILAWDDLVLYDKKLHVPHEQLHLRPFALWPLADVAPLWQYPIAGEFYLKTATEMVKQWGSRFDGKAPLHTKQILHRIDTAELVGIVNVTPDSFSKDGATDSEKILRHIHHLINSGASIIDIGAEATGPHATALSAKVEWQRLQPVLTKILAEKQNFLIPPKFSIDTYHPQTAEKVLALGVDWINDVNGLENPAMQAILKNYHNDIVFMHHLGVPVTKNITLPLNENPVATVYAWAKKQIQKLEQAGIDSQRLILDVGIGYGKTAEQ